MKWIIAGLCALAAVAVVVVVVWTAKAGPPSDLE